MKILLQMQAMFSMEDGLMGISTLLRYGIEPFIYIVFTVLAIIGIIALNGQATKNCFSYLSSSLK